MLVGDEEIFLECDTCDYNQKLENAVTNLYRLKREKCKQCLILIRPGPFPARHLILQDLKSQKRPGQQQPGYRRQQR